MPLVQRIVTPTQLCRGRIPDKSPDDLEAVCVNAFAGLIRQLSSLSKHANDIFTELFEETSHISKRIGSASARTEKLKTTLDAMDHKKAELFSARVDGNSFRRHDRLDQQVVSRISLPAPIMELYRACEPPPALNEMNPFRDDGKISLNFFTDPDYFLRLWCEEMREETEQKKKKKKKQRANRSATRPSEKKKVDRVAKKEYSAMGAEFAPSPAAITGSSLSAASQSNAAAAAAAAAPPRPEGAPPLPPSKPQTAPPPPPPTQKPVTAPPPPPAAAVAHAQAAAAQGNTSAASSAPSSRPPTGPPPQLPPPALPPKLPTPLLAVPPPPPPPPHTSATPQSLPNDEDGMLPPPPPTLASGGGGGSSSAGTAEGAGPSYTEQLPPPPMLSQLPPAALFSDTPVYEMPSSPLPPPLFMPPPPPPMGNLNLKVASLPTSGNALLDAILSKRLRAVNVKRESRLPSQSWKERTDVAAILARRMAVEASDSEDQSDSDSEWEDS